MSVPSAVLPAGGLRVAATPPSVQSLVRVEVLLGGVEASLEVLCCAVAGATEGLLLRQG